MSSLKRLEVTPAEFSRGAARLSPGTRENASPAQRTILELEGIKVTSLEKEEKQNSFHRCISVTCKSWLCPDCRRIKGHEIREKLIEKALTFKEPRLYTITVNRDWFKNPREAYEYVMHRKFIARLLTKEMKVRRWVWVLEAQEESGDGWPHWHILIDVADLPSRWYHVKDKISIKEKPENIQGWLFIPHFFDLNKVHSLLRKWEIGEQCYLSVRKDKFHNSKHAIYYITKYLIKTPKKGFPPWMWEFRNLRFYQPSYEVGSINSKESIQKPKKQEEKKEEVKEKKGCRSPLVRVSECKLKVIYKTYDKENDRMKILPPMWGMKEALKEYSGASRIMDFEFETLQSFPIYGFWNIDDLTKFQDLYNREEAQKAIQKKIADRKQHFLNAWAQAS